MSTRILITGATGLVGFAILKQALAEGHQVVFTARSAEKVKEVTSNPVIQKLNPGDRLSSVIVPDITVEGAFDNALHNISHIIHAGSPVPRVHFTDFKSEVYEPTVRSAEILLEAAARTPSIKRLVITNSYYAYFNKDLDITVPVKPSMRPPIPNPLPTEFSNGLEAYILAKRTEMDATDNWVEKNQPKFEVYRLPLGWVFGRDDLWLTAKDMTTRMSSNCQIIPGFTGQKNEFPMPPAACHLDDVANIHLKTALNDLPKDTPRDLGIAIDVPLDKTWEYAAKAFPDAAEKNLISPGTINQSPFKVDSSETERVFGIKFKTYEEMVKDLVGQYLELIGKEQA